MAGGSGTRFWPLSRSKRPKQFLPLASAGRTLIQATADRFSSLKRNSVVLVVTAASQAELAAEQLPNASILSEPQAKNTAACLAYAAKVVQDRYGDVPMVSVPADHLIEHDDQLIKIYDAALELAEVEPVLATIGIRPTAPETGFGYIKAGVAFGSTSAKKVERFVEKPDRATAESYLRSGDYLWNSGMFIWRPSVFLEAVRGALPELHSTVLKLAPGVADPDRRGEVEQLYGSIKPISVDHGVMEKAANVVVFPGSGFLWSDVGSWDAWREIAEKRSEAQASERAAAPNVISGNGVAIDSRGCMITTDDADGKAPLVALVGVEDLIVVSTGDAVLICRRGDSQQVKKVIDLLKERGKTDLL